MKIQKVINPGHDVTVDIKNNDEKQIVLFDFDTSSAVFDRANNDLIISFASGNKLVLSNFFVIPSDGSLPGLKLQDGTELSSADFLQSMNPDMDIATAAGPASIGSSGLGNYSDDSGHLIRGSRQARHRLLWHDGWKRRQSRYRVSIHKRH